jgi:predicted nucleic acid-binding protein
MSGLRETIAVDANPLLSALRGGKARVALLSGKFIFITTEYTTWEVKKYIPELSKESGVPESELFYAFDHFPIIAMPPVVYDEKRNQAENLIARRDPKDVDILALALKLDTPLWTNDKDFNNISELKVFTTSDMLEKLAAPTD